MILLKPSVLVAVHTALYQVDSQGRRNAGQAWVFLESYCSETTCSLEWLQPLLLEHAKADKPLQYRKQWTVLQQSGNKFSTHVKAA